jgi:uncharacterized integral membrane protein (TIGR00698 family)
MGNANLPPARNAVYLVLTAATAATLLALDAPSWAALLAGVTLALGFGRPAPRQVAAWTSRVLQWGVIGLGAGMNLAIVVRVGAGGALMTAATLALTFVVGTLVGRALRVPVDVSLLVNVGTAICGGSAIAAVSSVVKPKAHEMSVSLAVVFILNAAALVLFPPLGHAFGLSEVAFGRWSALAIHDTSSVVGAALSYGPTALDVATTTKLARALWIVPITLGIALLRQGGSPTGLRAVKWPWFIAGFLAMAALFTWLPALAPVKEYVATVARRLLVIALFLIGLSLSRDALRTVGWRPLVQGVLLWSFVGVASLFLAKMQGGG